MVWGDMQPARGRTHAWASPGYYVLTPTQYNGANWASELVLSYVALMFLILLLVLSLEALTFTGGLTANQPTADGPGGVVEFVLTLAGTLNTFKPTEFKERLASTIPGVSSSDISGGSIVVFVTVAASTASALASTQTYVADFNATRAEVLLGYDIESISYNNTVTSFNPSPAVPPLSPPNPHSPPLSPPPHSPPPVRPATSVPPQSPPPDHPPPTRPPPPLHPPPDHPPPPQHPPSIPPSIPPPPSLPPAGPLPQTPPPPTLPPSPPVMSPSPPAAPATICEQSCIDFKTLTDDANSYGYIYKYDSSHHTYDDFGPSNAWIPGRTSDNCAQDFRCWRYDYISSNFRNENSIPYQTNNNGWCEDGVAPVEGGNAFGNTNSPFGDGRGFYSLTFSRDGNTRFPITFQYNGNLSEGAPSSITFTTGSRDNTPGRTSKTNQPYLYMPAVCPYGHDCADCGPRLASSAPWARRRLSDDDWIEYPEHGYKTRRGSANDLHFVRELAIGKREGLFTNFSVPLEMAYAIDAIDTDTGTIPPLSREDQRAILARHTTPRHLEEFMRAHERTIQNQPEHEVV